MQNRNIKFIPETGDLDTPYCTGRELMDATKTVVKTLGRDNKVTVNFEGNQAYTNGERVVLPSLPDDAVLTKREGLVTAGYANHETLHNLLTNQRRSSKSVQLKHKWHTEGKKFTKSLQNGMEDVRIERGGMELYVGLPKSIDKTAHSVTKSFVEDVYPENPNKVNDIKVIGSVAVTWEGRRRLGYLSEYNQKALDLLPPHVMKWVNQVVDITMAIPHGVTGMGEINREIAFKGSDDLHETAERISNELAKGNYPDGTPLPPTTTGGQRGGEETGEGTRDTNGGRTGGVTGTGQASDDESSTGDNSQGNERGSEDESTGDDSNQTSGHSHGATNQDTESDQINWDDPVEVNLAEALEDIFKGAESTGSYRVHSRDNDYWYKRKDCKISFEPMRSETWSVLNQTHSGVSYDQVKKRLGNVLGTMKRKLELALVSEQRSEISRRKKHGRLDSRKLTNVVSFDTEVFRRRVMSTAINTAVTIVVDLSGSMSGGRLELARSCCVAIANALENTQVSLEIVGHCTTHRTLGSTETDVSEHQTKINQRRYNRRDAIRMVMFKGFGERLTHCRKAIGGMTNTSHCANADGDAWLYAYERLIKQPQQRKVMLCLSDGYPAYNSDYNDQYQRTSDVVAYMSKQVDVIGVGIQSKSVKNFFPKYVVVNELAELPKEVMDKLGKALLGQNFKVDNSDLIKANRING